MKLKIEIELSLTWFEQYQVLAKKNGRSLDELFLDALGQYIGINSPKKQNNAYSSTTLPALSQKPPKINSVPEDDEEDEPDEVLESFLPPVF